MKLSRTLTLVLCNHNLLYLRHSNITANFLIEKRRVLKIRKKENYKNH